MKKIILICTALCAIGMRASAQFFPEGYEKTIPDFCVDCGNPKAMPPDDMLQQLMIRFEPKAFNKTRGKIYIQVLVDSTGTAKLLTAKNLTNVKSKKLNLQHSVNSIKWTPSSDKRIQSVVLVLNFLDDRMEITRMEPTTSITTDAQQSQTSIQIEPLQITNMEEGKFPKYEFTSKRDSNLYAGFSIDTDALFYRCNADTMLVGYVLVAINGGGTAFYYPKCVSWDNYKDIRLNKDISITDVQNAENTLAKHLPTLNHHRIDEIIECYKKYGRQYIFYYNENGDECVLINCSCEKYDWLFSRRYKIVRDGGACYWQIIINLSNDKIINFHVNGDA